jgi:hypothetical protein
MSVDSFFLPLTFGSFVVTGMFRVVQIIFPFSVIGILSKEIQESIYGFNNNGLYIGVISLFSATSELTVQVYGTEKFAPLGTGNYMALPCVLFILSIGCTYSFRYAVTSSGSANGTSNEGETFSNREGQVDCL